MNTPDLRLECGSEEVGNVSDSPSPKRTSCQSRRPAGIGARKGCRDGNHDKRVFAVLPKENALSGAGGWHSEQLAHESWKGHFPARRSPCFIRGTAKVACRYVYTTICLSVVFCGTTGLARHLIPQGRPRRLSLFIKQKGSLGSLFV